MKKKYFKNNLDDLNKAYLSVPYIIDKNFERIDYFILTFIVMNILKKYMN